MVQVQRLGFYSPIGVAVDVFENIYLADYDNNLIRKITSGGVVTTFAGSGMQGNTNGPGTVASFWFPTGVAVDASGNVYVADDKNNLIRKITSVTTGLEDQLIRSDALSIYPNPH